MVLLLICLCGCGSEQPADTGELPEQLCQPGPGDRVAEIETSAGTIKLLLFPEYAPQACENFESLAAAGYYDGCSVHKIIEDFCIQMGDPTGTGSGGESIWSEGFEPEFSDQLHNYVGAVGVATGDSGLGGSQFYIISGGEVTEELAAEMTAAGYPQQVVDSYLSTGGQPLLDYRYAVFAQVYEGLDVVQKISGKNADELMRPERTITVKSVRVYQLEPEA